MALSILLTDIGSITSISKFCLLDGALGADANGNSSDDINIDNTNNSAFPSTGTIFVDGEEIRYTSKGSSTQFTTITRGVNNTNAVAHADDANVTGVKRYALKADAFGVSIAKTPIQIPFPQNSPELIEIGMFRPSITVSGTVDRDQSTTPEVVTGPAKGNSSDGNRRYVPGLIRAAVAQGIDGVFMECHQDPDNAPSDGPNMLKMEDCEKVFEDIKKYSYD